MKDAFTKAAGTLSRLVAPNAEAPLARAMPRLGALLEEIPAGSEAYLAHEYAHDHWQPFFVADVHRHAAEHRLQFVASATLPENHIEGLPTSFSSVILEDPDPLMRQALLDLAINQSFRRDIFVKGHLRMSHFAQSAQLSEIRLRAVAAPPSGPQAEEQESCIETSFGMVNLGVDLLRRLGQVLSGGSCLLGDIAEVLEVSPREAERIVALLLHSGRIGLDRGEAANEVFKSCRLVNARVMGLMRSGVDLGFVAAPHLGHGAHVFSVLDAYILEGIQQGLDGDLLLTCLLIGVGSAGIQLRNSEGVLCEDEGEMMKVLEGSLSAFQRVHLPLLRRIGIVD